MLMARSGIAGQGSGWEPAGEKHPRAAGASGEQAAPSPASRLRSFAVKPRQASSNHLWRIEDWEKRADAVGFNPDDMAANAGVGLRQLERFFKARFGKTPTVWVKELRCSRAVKLIREGEKIGWVAKHLGFASHSHFCHEFKKAYGVAPQSFARHEGSAEMSPLSNNVAFKQYFAVDARLRTLQPWRRSV